MIKSQLIMTLWMRFWDLRDKSEVKSITLYKGKLATNKKNESSKTELLLKIIKSKQKTKLVKKNTHLET